MFGDLYGAGLPVSLAVVGDNTERGILRHRNVFSPMAEAGVFELACEFLRCDFRQLVARYGRVYGRKIPTPKLIRVG